MEEEFGYWISCKECEEIYIGETKFTIKKKDETTHEGREIWEDNQHGIPKDYGVRH